jgi:hypothetical protein
MRIEITNINEAPENVQNEVNETCKQNGIYKVLECIEDEEEKNSSIYNLEGLGVINLSEWDGDTYHKCGNTDLLLKPRTTLIFGKDLYITEDIMYFYSK